MWVKVFVLCAFSVGSLYSDNDSKCDITDIPSVDWVLGYESNMNDNEINKRIFNGTYTGKLDNLKCSCTIDNPNSVCKETYFQATLDTKTTQFLVETTDALKNFDEDINTILSKPEPSLLLFYKCNMTCQNPTTPSLLPFAITVTDYNDFRPDFSTGDTVYKVSSPIMKEADFSVYGAEIYATDKDFGNEDITFKIDPDDFDIVKTVTDDKPRKFKVHFKANKVLQLTQDKKYTITATDSGKIPGPLSSTLQVTLKVDPENVVDYPNFEYTSKSYEYAFRYEKNHTLTTINGPIKVTTNKPSDLEKSISLSGDLSGNFGATFDTSSSTIKVSIKTNIDNPTSAFVVLSLNVQTDAKVSAPVVIYFANAPKDDIPKFNQHLYTGKYDDSTNKISLDQDITVSSTSALSTSSFKITGDFYGNFEIKLDDDKKSYLLDVNKALTPTEIKSKEYLSLTIEVTVNSKSDTTGVIVYLPAHSLKFKEVLYTATYFENNTIAASTISFASDVTNSKVSVKVEDTYSKNFEVKPTSKSDYALGLISNLPDAVLQTQTEISIVLTASDKYDNQARSVVKMALPQQKAVEAPKFSQLAYKIKYNEGQKSGVLDFDTPPSFVNYADPSAIKIDLKTYAKYFTVAFDSTTKKFGVKVLQALDSSFLKNNELVETMVAVKTNVAAKGNAVLVVELVKLKPGSPPTFEKPSYTAVYKKGLKVNDYIDFDQVVSLKNVVNLKNVAIKLDSNEANFKVLLESNKWRIQLLKPIDDDTFRKINDIVITMEVSESGISGQSIGVLVINLSDPSKDDKAPNFEKPFYTVQYNTTAKYMDFEPAIKFTNVDVDSVQMTLSDRSDNFELVLDNGIWKLKLSKPLDESILENSTEIAIKIEATEKGLTGTGYSVLILELTGAKKEAPAFKNPYYLVQYQKTDSYIDFNPAIAFDNIDVDKVILVINTDYKDYFQMDFDSNKWRIKVLKPLTDELLLQNELVTTIQASEDGVTKKSDCVLVMNLKDNTAGAPQFKDPYYIVQYNTTVKYMDFEPAINFNNVDVGSVKMTLSDRSDNFELVLDNGIWKLKLSKPLDESILENSTEIAIKIEATEKGLTGTGYSVLILELTGAKKEAPEFKNPYYLVQYQKTDSYIDFNPAIAFDNIDVDKVILVINTDYKDYFQMDFDSNKWRIKVLKPLTDELLLQNELVTTIQASEDGVTKKSDCVLVMNLKDNTAGAPQFKDPYYIVKYNTTVKYMDFKPAIKFTNVDVGSVQMTLSDRSDNFELVLDNGIWKLKITKPLDESILENLTEIAIKMEAAEKGLTGRGYNVLILELTGAKKEAPEFKNPYYLVQYQKDQKAGSYLDFSPAIAFDNINVDKAVLKLSDYSKYFELDLDATKKVWRIKVKAPLDDAILKHNAELHTTMEATEMGVTGVGVLIIQLPNPDITDNTPVFSDLYYKVVYKQGQTGFLDFTNDIAFNNVPDISIVDINLYTYMDNFKLVYNNKKWRIKIDRALDDKVFATSTTLVDTMEASLPDVMPAGDVVLMIDLVANVPQFGNDYYTAAYPVGGSGIFYFDNDLDFKNVDPKDVQLYLDNYYGNFDITYNSVAKKWQIDIKTPLDDSVISKNEYLVTKLTAKIVSIGSELTATVVLKLPKKQAPVFSRTSFKAEYTIQKNHPVVTFTDSIGFKNKPNMANINIVSDDFSGYFTFKYSTNSWQMIVDKPLHSTNLDKTNLVVTITAIDITDMLQAHSTIDLKLPPADTKDAPKFEKSYYKGRYEVVKDVGKVILDEDIQFSNKVGHTDIGIIIDSGYNKFFEFSLDLQSKWTVLVKKPLNSSILSSGNDIIMQMVANELGIKDVGKSTLLLTLPKINDDQAPKFDHISYRSLCSANTTKLDIEIKITNRKKEDLKNIVVAIQEDEYSDNFDVKFDAATSSWYVEVKSTPKTMGDKNNLVLTLSATESNNKTEVGLAGLVIEFPVFIAPEFSANPYVGTYNVADGTLKIIDFNVVNKDQSKLKLSFSSKDGDFSKYLSINYDKADKIWKMLLTNPIDKLTVTNNDEIVLTITAKENDNPKQGETTAIIKIIDESKNKNDIQFSRAHYSASYRIVDNTPVVKLNEYIRVTSTKDVTKATVSIQSASDFEPAKYFKIVKKTDHFEIVALEPLTIDILRKFTNLIVTLMVELGNTKNYATLIIDLSAVESGDDIKFNSVVYMGTYENRNNVNKITCDPINVITTSPENIYVSITNAYKEYFSLTYNAKDSSVALNLAKSIPASVIEDFSTVAVVVQAMNGLSHKIANAVINLRIISDDTPIKNGVVLFNKISNTAKYLQGSFTLDNSIGLTTDRKEDEIKASIEDSAFSKYFTAYYKNQEVTVKLTREIPQENITSKPFITLTLVASIVNTNETSKASLTVQLDNDHHETLKATKYIVSISLLAVLIVLLILAAVAFYYLRLRKKNEVKMTEDEYIEKREVRFESTSRPSDKSSRSSAIEGRRPTGFIFKRQDEDEDESSTDGSAKERKKSVVFDEVVEKLKMEDEVEKPDLDD